LNAATIDVKEPERSPVEKLTHSGLGFAFANREGKTTFHSQLTEAELQLDRWRLPWTPARQRANVQEEQVDDERAPLDIGDAPLLFKAHAAFVNPHATSRRSYRRDIPNRVQGWLTSLLPPRARGTGGFLDDLQALVYELVDNVAEHAWPQGEAQPLSLVQVSVARGNSSDIRDRIWVVVLDTGPGIPKTAAPKIGGSRTHHDLVKGLLNGEFLQSNHRARGFGLPRVAKICSRWRDSKLELFSDEVRITSENGDVTTTATSHRIRGTLIVARFSTPPISNTN
jgi:hypothetical protein